MQVLSRCWPIPNLRWIQIGEWRLGDSGGNDFAFMHPETNATTGGKAIEVYTSLDSSKQSFRQYTKFLSPSPESFAFILHGTSGVPVVSERAALSSAPVGGATCWVDIRPIGPALASQTSHMVHAPISRLDEAFTFLESFRNIVRHVQTPCTFLQRQAARTSAPGGVIASSSSETGAWGLSMRITLPSSTRTARTPRFAYTASG